jgi:hypothetical protein
MKKSYPTSLERILEIWRKKIEDPSNKNRYRNFLNNPEVQSYIKQCIDEDRPIYCFAKTQSGKTQFKQELAKLVITKGWKDVVIISTTNMTDAMTQLNDRVSQYFALYRINCYTTDNFPARANPRDVIVTMTNALRTGNLYNFLENSYKHDVNAMLLRPEEDLKHLSYLVIYDEGEEFEMAAGDTSYDGKKAEAEKELWNLFFGLRNKGVEIDMVKVSATLAATLYTSGTWAGAYGDLKPYQLFELPLSSDYIGIDDQSGNFTIVDNLVNEDTDIFFRGSLTDKAQSPSDSKNIPNIVESIESLIQHDKFKTVQIGNVVYGVSIASHIKMAELMSEEFESVWGRKTAIWSRKDQNATDFPKNTDVLFIVQNGLAEKRPISSKLCDAADYFANLKAVVICADKMANKSITIDTGHESGWDNPNSNRFGFYCNFTVLYGPENRSVEADIQYLRCTGNRPPIKKHYVFTTTKTMESINSYYENQYNNIEDIKSKGGWSGVQLIDYTIDVAKRISKGNVDKRFIRASNSAFSSSRRKGIDISLPHRDQLVKQHGFRERDMLFKLSKKEFDNADSKSKIIELAKSKGFGKEPYADTLFEFSDTWVQVNTPKQMSGLKAESGVRVKMKVGDSKEVDGELKTPDWIISMYQSGKDYYLYCMNNDLWPLHQNEVEYKVSMVNGDIQFNQAQMFRYDSPKTRNSFGAVWIEK